MSPPNSTVPVTDSIAKIDGEVAIGEDLTFQRTWWRFERIVWGVFVLILALDLGGVFGRGPVAHASLRSTDGALDVQYERVERTGTPSMMTLSLGQAMLRGGTTKLFLSDSIVSGLGAQRVIPQPLETTVGGGGLTYMFKTTTAPAIVRFELQPAGPGIYPFVISAPGMKPLSSTIVVVP